MSNMRAKAQKLAVISTIRSLLSHISTCNVRFIWRVSHDCGFACMDGAKMFLDSKQVNWQGAWGESHGGTCLMPASNCVIMWETRAGSFLLPFGGVQWHLTCLFSFTEQGNRDRWSKKRQCLLLCRDREMREGGAWAEGVGWRGRVSASRAAQSLNRRRIEFFKEGAKCAEESQMDLTYQYESVSLKFKISYLLLTFKIN